METLTPKPPLGDPWERQRFFCFRPPHVTQCGLAAANVRLTAIRNGSRDITNCGVRIVMCRRSNGIASTAIATDKSCEGGNCFVANLSAGIRVQNLDEVGYNIGDANIFLAAPLTGEAV